jgi:peptide/nickel transport system ATP-binding protein
LLSVRDLTIRATADGRTITTGIDLTVHEGETVAIVGESGSGKSLTTRAILGLLPTGVSATGHIEYQGYSLLDMKQQDLNRIRGRAIALIMQDPFTMLNPLMRVEDHVIDSLRGEQWARAGGDARRAEARRRLAEVGITREGIGRQYPFELSGGMRQRVGIAAALAGDPGLLIADEATTALDVTIQKEILDLLQRLQSARKMSLLLVTHDLRVAFTVAQRVYVMYAGSIMEMASPRDLLRQPLHPYSHGLMLSEPPIDYRAARLIGVPGSVPDPDSIADLCSFTERCPYAQDQCRQGRPELREVGDGRLSACRRVDEIRDLLVPAPLTPEAPVQPRTGETRVLSVESLGKVFVRGGRSAQRVEALVDASIAMVERESVGLVGESGSGKTTLGRCVAGLESPTSGRIVFDGRDVTDYRGMDVKERRWLHRNVQMVFQDPYSSLNPARTIGSTLSEAVAIREPGDRIGDAEALLRMVGLPVRHARRLPSALSGGERQRVAIARAIAVRPRVLICDEPVSALDVSVQAQILELLRSLREELGLQYLFITHDLAVVRQMVDRVYVLYQGRVVESGPAAQVLDAPEHPYTRKLVSSVLSHTSTA